MELYDYIKSFTDYDDVDMVSLIFGKDTVIGLDYEPDFDLWGNIEF